MPQVEGCKFPWIIRLSGEDLPKKDKDILGNKISSDPYFVIRRASGPLYKAPNKDSQGNQLVGNKRTYEGHPLDGACYISEYIPTNLNPSWKSFVLDTSRENGEFDVKTRFLIDVWDYDGIFLRSDFIGYFEFSLEDLLWFYTTKTAITLLPPTANHNQNAGKLWVHGVVQGLPTVTISKNAIQTSSQINNFTPFALKAYLLELDEVKIAQYMNAVDIGSIAHLDESGDDVKCGKYTKGPLDPAVVTPFTATSTKVTQSNRLAKANFVIIVHSSGVVLAKKEIPRTSGENASLNLTLSSDLESCTMALDARTLSSRLDSAYNRANELLKWLLNGFAVPRDDLAASRKIEYEKCEQTYRELLPFANFLGLHEETLASDAAFRDALIAQTKLLKRQIEDFPDPFTKQSPAGATDNRVLHNDKISKFCAKVRTLTIASKTFDKVEEVGKCMAKVKSFIQDQALQCSHRGQKAAKSHQFVTAASELQKLVVIKESALTGNSLDSLILDDLIQRWINSVLDAIKQSIFDLKSNCCKEDGDDYVLICDNNTLSNQCYDRLLHAVLALVKGNELWCDHSALKETTTKVLSDVMKAFQRFINVWKVNFDREPNQSLVQLSKVGTILESIISCAYATDLIQNLQQFLKEKAEAEIQEFRVSLQAHNAAEVIAILKKHNNSEDFGKLLVEDVSNFLKSCGNTLREWLSRKPRPATLPVNFTACWRCFCILLDSRNDVSLIGELSPADVPPSENSLADELDMAIKDMYEGLSTAEVDAKNFLIAELQAKFRSASDTFSTVDNALAFLLESFIAKQGIDKTSPQMGCKTFCNLFDQVMNESEQEVELFEATLSSNTESSDFDLQEASLLLKSLYAKADLLAKISLQCAGNESLRDSLLRQHGSPFTLTRERVNSVIQKFIAENFPTDPKLHLHIDAAQREKKFRFIAKSLRAAKNLDNFLSNCETKYTVTFCGDVENSIRLLFEELDKTFSVLPTLALAMAELPSVETINNDIIDKLRKINFLTANISLVRSYVLPDVLNKVQKWEDFDEMQELRTRMQILIQHIQKEDKNSFKKLAKIFIHMHVHVLHVLTFAEEGKRLMEVGFDKYKEKFAGAGFGMNFVFLGDELQQDDYLSLGKSVVQSYDAFKANTIQNFNLKTKDTRDIKKVLPNLRFTEDQQVFMLKNFENIDEEWQKNLKDALAKHFGGDCKENLIESIKNLAAKMREGKVLEMSATAGKWKSDAPANVAELIGKILFLWTLQQANKLKSVESTNKEGFLCRPHPVQIVAILCLLGFGQGRDSSLIIERCLVQVKTGEGKTLIMGVVACVFALLGQEVSCACYSDYLSKRDYDYMKDIFSALEVACDQKNAKHSTGTITYCTLVELCELEINKGFKLRDRVRGMITGSSTSTGGASAPLADSSHRILLVDEVDVFFSKDFYGETYSPACDLTKAKITDLFRKIWTERSNEPTPTEVMQWVEYQDLSKELGEWQSLLEAAMTRILADLRTFSNHKYVVQNGLIGYKEQDKIALNVRKGYSTFFAYLKEEENGKIKREVVERNLGLLIKCGTFLFAKFPNRFALVSGVTGTLETLGDAERNVIEEQYQIKRMFYMPSAYKEPQFKDKGIVVTDSSRHFEKICTNIEENLFDNNVARAVLVFFKDITALENFNVSNEFEKTLAKFTLNKEKINKLVEEAPKADREQIVSSLATSPKAITLATSPFGRGTDFISMDPQVNNAGGLHVVQTFLSDSEAEEVQIRGRTARQGDKGSYSLILNRREIAKDFFSDDEKDLHDGVPLETLKHQRSKNFEAEFCKLRSLVLAQEKNDELSWQLVTELMKGNPGSAKAILESFNPKIPLTRILMAVDATGSMGGVMTQLKLNLEDMFSRAKQILDQKMKEDPSAQFEMQLIGFRNYGSGKSMLLERSRWVRDPAELIEFLQKLTAKGGQGNEAIEVAFQHAVKQADLKRIILIGDAPPNTETEVNEKRATCCGDVGGYDGTVNENHWIGTEFEEKTTWKVQLGKIKEKKIVVDAFYLAERAREDFTFLATETQGKIQNIENDYKDKEKLINLITGQILTQVGGPKNSELLLQAYREAFSKTYV